MGRRGPAPKPTAAKIADGETRPSRVNYEEPIPRQDAPKPPRALRKEAKAVWTQVLKSMGSARVILLADAFVLETFCETVVDYREHIRDFHKVGALTRGARSGDIIINPLSRLVREEREAIRLLSRELGLSPAARANLRLEPGEGEGDMDDILGPPRLRVVNE